MGCLVSIIIKDINPDDKPSLYRVLSKHSYLFGKKIDIISESISGGKPELMIYVPWDENKTSEKLMYLKDDKRIQKARIVC